MLYNNRQFNPRKTAFFFFFFGPRTNIEIPLELRAIQISPHTNCKEINPLVEWLQQNTLDIAMAIASDLPLARGDVMGCVHCLEMRTKKHAAVGWPSPVTHPDMGHNETNGQTDAS